MLTLMYALALSATVGDCSNTLGNPDAYFACADAEFHANQAIYAAQSRARLNEAPIRLQLPNTPESLAAVRARNAIAERDDELRVALQQQRLQQHLAEMRRITEQFKSHDQQTVVTFVGQNGQMWRAIFNGTGNLW